MVSIQVKDRLLNQALLALLHWRRLATLAGLPHGAPELLKADDLVAALSETTP